MYNAYLDLRVVGSFMTMTSVMSPYLVKYSLRLSETRNEIIPLLSTIANRLEKSSEKMIIITEMNETPRQY